MSLLGLTGQSSTNGPRLLDRSVEPGDDSELGINLAPRFLARSNGKTDMVSSHGRSSHKILNMLNFFAD
jgi:hypothetical protein